MTIAGEVMRICRLREKATQKEVATMLGVSRQTIQEYECGVHEPRFSAVYEFLQLLGYEMVIRKKNESNNDNTTGFNRMENEEDSKWKLQLR